MADDKLTIPPELENLLLEYTINAIVENPDDLVSHAAEYFAKLRSERCSEEEGNALGDVDEEGKALGEVDEGSQEFIEKQLGSRARFRRGTVAGESYNPEEDDVDDDTEIEIVPKTDEERKRIKERCSDIFLFRVLDDEDLSAVIDAMVMVTVKDGEEVIKQGDDGDFFYLIDRGQFKIFIQDPAGEVINVGDYSNEGFFGELALLHNQPRAATIKAVSDGTLWSVDRKTFNKLIVKRAFEKRQAYMNLFNKCVQLKPLTEYERMQVADALVPKSFKQGDVVVNEGDEGDGMYFVVEGTLSVKQKNVTDVGGADIELAQLTVGDFFGELSLVKDQPRAATVTAMEDTKVAFLDVKAFERLLGPCLDILARHADTYESQ